MKLTDLDPRFYSSGGEGITDSKTGEPTPLREGVGIGFDCPCGCETRVYIDFKNPMDGGPQLRGDKHAWTRTGDTFADITLRPSIQRMGGCKWHGFLTDGELVSC